MRARVKTVSRRVTDGAHISPDTNGGVFDFVSTRDVKNGTIDFIGSLKTSPETYAYMVRTGCRPECGDVLFSKDGSIGTTALVVDDRDFVVASSLIIVSPDRRRMTSRFLNYAFSSRPVAEQARTLTRGAGLPRISVANLARIELPCPPPDEQRAIADFLDHETAQIDALVAKQEEFVRLLRERRSRAREALAARVAEGQRLRWVLREVDRRAGARAADLSLMSVSIDWGVRRRDETTDRLARAEDLGHYKVCLEGDIVVNRMRAFQGALGVAPEDGLVSPDYAVLRAAPQVNTSWLTELMRTRAFVGEITLRLRGIGGTDSGNVRTPRINTADLFDIRADIPDLDVQQAELTILRTETSQIDALIAKADEHIALAKERRSALITAAVTGWIDVRTERKAS